jgi:hypothetical protein
MVTVPSLGLSRRYHASCFCCEGCQQPISTNETVSVHGEPPQPYHPQCARDLFNPRCSLCAKSVSGQYYRHPFFEEELYCKDAAHDRRRKCFSCGRREPFAVSRSAPLRAGPY